MMYSNGSQDGTSPLLIRVKAATTKAAIVTALVLVEGAVLCSPVAADARPPSGAGEEPPAEVGRCSLVEHLCSVDEDGAPVNVITYLCPWGPVVVRKPGACPPKGVL